MAVAAGTIKERINCASDGWRGDTAFITHCWSSYHIRSRNRPPGSSYPGGLTGLSLWFSKTIKEPDLFRNCGSQKLREIIQITVS